MGKVNGLRIYAPYVITTHGSLYRPYNNKRNWFARKLILHLFHDRAIAIRNDVSDMIRASFGNNCRIRFLAVQCSMLCLHKSLVRLLLSHSALSWSLQERAFVGTTKHKW